MTAEKIIIAVGARPMYPGIPGDKEYGITSDDLFNMTRAPGKTLIIGASLVALECAGFLNRLGYKTKVMVRSILLRGFDQDMAEREAKFMQGEGVEFIRGATPVKLERPEDGGPITVTYDTSEGQEKEEFDTVLFAIGRRAQTDSLNLEAAGVVAEKNGKIKVGNDESTTVDNIFAVGDVIFGKPELTPVANKVGELLAKRLFGGST